MSLHPATSIKQEGGDSSHESVGRIAALIRPKLAEATNNRAGISIPSGIGIQYAPMRNNTTKKVLQMINRSRPNDQLFDVIDI